MSGSQHNPNGRQSQLGSGWSPLQLQMANLLARAPQAHMASDRGVTWHTPTPPPHLYHVPAPSPPDPLQAMKSVGNSVFRHTATPPELYRHTPTPPDKHMMRHTPSPGDVKSGPPLPPVDLYPHLGPGRDKLVRAEELLAYARVGVDLSLGGRANGAPVPAPAPTLPPHQPPPAHSPALSVRDAPTINSLIARSGARRVDSLLERLAPAPALAPSAASAPAPALAPAPASPHSVIVHPRAQPTPSPPPSSNEDSADSWSAAAGSKRKRKPERTVRVPAPAPPHHPPAAHPAKLAHNTPTSACASPASVQGLPVFPPPAENGDAAHAELHTAGRRDEPSERSDPPAPGLTPTADELDSARRKTRSGSAETIADIAAMIALGGAGAGVGLAVEPRTPPPAALSVDKLKSVLASPEPETEPEPEPEPDHPAVSPSTLHCDATERTTSAAMGSSAAAPRRAGAPQPPAESPCEGKPAEGACAGPEGTPPSPSASPPHASFVEVENQLEKMFAGLEECSSTRPSSAFGAVVKESAPASKRRKSAPGRGREAPPRRKGPRKKPDSKGRKKNAHQHKEGYDSGSNASSGRSRGPYIQIRGPRSSPVSVCVMNAGTGEEEEGGCRRRGGERRRGLHASTLGLRYDAATRDPTWLCAFCQRGPHAATLGDLFGPYPLEAADVGEVWVHAACALWAPGVVAAGARIWGLADAVRAARAERCRHCVRPAAPVACATRACPHRAHLPCARAAQWRLDETDFRALCPTHAELPTDH